MNNAGITRDGTLARMTRDMWDAVIDTNLGSCYNFCKLTFDGMRAAKFGRIVNIGSINGQAGQYGQVNYAAAKSGIHGFTKALAQEGARFGITVNAIAPGYVDTDMVRAVPPEVLEKIVARIPVGRLGHAADIARGVAFLTADDAGVHHRLDAVDQRRAAHVLSRRPARRFPPATVQRHHLRTSGGPAPMNAPRNTQYRTIETHRIAGSLRRRWSTASICPRTCRTMCWRKSAPPCSTIA